MGKSHVLVVEDDKDIQDLLVYNLTKSGFTVMAVTNGEDALLTIKTKHFDLILLDVMLPGLDGFEICRRLKYDPRSRSIPVIMLTARSDDTDIVAGLELGADCYLIKPFSPSVLLAHIRAVLRRKHDGSVENTYSLIVHDLVIDSRRFLVSHHGRFIELSSTEFKLLTMLAHRPGWVFSRDQIVNSIHGDDCKVTNRSIDVHVVGLRKKLGVAGEYIETVRGAGYRFRE